MSRAADSLIDLLEQHDVKLFIGAGAGTDFPPIIEAFAARQLAGKQLPRALTVVHEATAVSFAHGYSMVSGETPCVMMHTTVGTANGICGIINAARADIPMFIWAGRTPISESGFSASRRLAIHWAQESFDQAGMLREYVKWDYELKQESELNKIVSRALAIARSEPQGPVYLGLPLEVLEASVPRESTDDLIQTEVSLQQAAGEEIELLIAKIESASNPLIITSSLGRDHRAVELLETFIDKFAIPVVEHWPTYMNLRRDHKLHFGFDPHHYIQAADLAIVLESPVPWYPKIVTPGEKVQVVNIARDALFQNYPLRSFHAQQNISANPALVLEELLGKIGHSDLIDERRGRYLDLNSTAQDKGLVNAQSSEKGISKSWISRCIDEQRKEDDIVITEYVLDQKQMTFSKAGTFFDHSPAGGLGWAIGAALGAKYAQPDRTVICCVGDGAYTFGAPVSTHQLSAMYNLPVLYIVFNNGTLNTTKQTVLNSYPDGAAAKLESIPFCDLASVPAYEKVCEAAGGYGECVTDAEEVPKALKRALEQVQRHGRQALLNVICDTSSFV